MSRDVEVVGAKRTDRDLARSRVKRYPACRESRVEWLGEIPTHWEVRKWRYCCRVTEGQVAPDDDRYRTRVLIAPNHIESGTGRILFTETADDQAAISGKYLVNPGDLIYSKIRPALNKACIATGDWLCSADMYPVKITASVLSPSFLLYFILSEPFVRLMVDESMRVAMPKVNRDKLAMCPLLIPPASEQRAIVAFLDRETARIDGLVAKKERLIELLEEKRAALVTHAVTKGLDANVPMKESNVEWLGEIPAHWEVRQLGQTMRMIMDFRGRTPPKLGMTWGGEIPAISAMNARDGHLDLSLGVNYGSEALHDRWMTQGPTQKDDVLFTTEAPLGNVALVPDHDRYILSQRVVLLRADRDALQPRYLRSFLISSAFRQGVESRATGSTAEGIKRRYLMSMPVCVPPIAEQRTLVEVIDSATAAIDGLADKVRRAIRLLYELRSALISAAVTGKIDVREEVA